MGAETTRWNDIKKDIIESVLRNFWLSIYRGKLEVEVKGRGLVTTISKHTITKLMEEYFTEEEDTISSTEHYNPRPYFDTVRYSESDETCNESYIKTKLDIEGLGKCALYIKTNTTKKKVIYMRSPLMYVYSKTSGWGYDVNALFVCENKDGNEFLRSVESATHDSWSVVYLKEKSNKKAGKILKGIDKAIKSKLEELFRLDSNEELKVDGVDDYLYSIENMMPGSFEKGRQQQIRSTAINETKRQTSTKSQGSGVITLTNRGRVTPNESGDTKAGIGHEHNGKGHANKNHSAGRNKTIKSVIEEGDGTYLEEIEEVKYRIIAQKENDGKIYHTIIFHSTRSAISSEIYLECATDDEATEKIDIVWCDKGKSIGNVVYGCPVEVGKNILKVRFDDNMQHSIRLKAYEHKK